MYMIHSVTDIFDLSPVLFFEQFVVESENDVIVLHRKGRFGSFVLLQLRLQFFANLAFLLQFGRKIF